MSFKFSLKNGQRYGLTKITWKAVPGTWARDCERIVAQHHSTSRHVLALTAIMSQLNEEEGVHQRQLFSGVLQCGGLVPFHVDMLMFESRNTPRSRAVDAGST